MLSVNFLQRPLFLFLLLLGFAGCFPPGEQVPDRIIIDLEQADQQRLRNFQDQLQADSLATYLSNENPSLRYLAATGFGSMQTTDAKRHIPALTNLLSDEYYDIRSAAAFALGQIGDPAAADGLLAAFQKRDSSAFAKALRRDILVAVGKCGDKSLLPLLSSVNYANSDTLLLEGQALGIYHFGLRKIMDAAGTEKIMQFVKDNQTPESVQFIGSNYLFRNGDQDFTPYVDQLIAAFSSVNDERTKMALAVTLGRTKDAKALDALFEQYPKEQDYRVKCNILRGLSNFDYREVEPIFTAALNNNNFNIAKSAADFFVEQGKAYDCSRYLQRAKSASNLHPLIRHYLLGAANAHLPYQAESTRFEIVEILEKSFNEETDITLRMAALEAIGQFPWYFRKVFELGNSSQSEVLKSKATQVLRLISNRSDFDTYFGQSRRRVRREMANYFSEALSSENAGAIAEAAQALANPAAKYPELFTSTAELILARASLDLPKEVEIYDLLQIAIDHFNGVPNVDLTKPDIERAIDWDVFRQLPERPIVTLSTKRGDVSLELFKDETPGSVVNIWQLAKSGFFNDLNFHRVVPNFVVQGGCPRGDGYGGLDYSIRSEFTKKEYDQAGMLGMASAGPHTECTQFFITHSPAMHLSGKYTLFGRVIEGMDIVHKIEPGDKIIRAVTN